MKYVITEQQQIGILYSVLDDMFSDFETKFEGDNRMVYKDGELLAILQPTRCVLTKKIFDYINDNLFYDSISDIKDDIRKWVLNKFGVRQTAQRMYGINFEDFSGKPEVKKERPKYSRREPAEPKVKKTPEQKKRERDGYQDTLRQIEKDRREIDKKYGLTESKLDKNIINYLDKLFDVDNIHYTVPYEYNDETGEEGDDDTRMEFYIGDYENDDTCFRWYDCTYFTNQSDSPNKLCPIVQVEYQYETTLNGYFGDKWKEPFKKWFTHHFEIPVNLIGN
jgi:hypothetical protein